MPAGKPLRTNEFSSLPTTGPRKSPRAGAIIREDINETTLDDERFAEENGIKGFWQPISFFRELGGNIYYTAKLAATDGITFHAKDERPNSRAYRVFRRGEGGGPA